MAAVGSNKKPGTHIRTGTVEAVQVNRGPGRPVSGNAKKGDPNFKLTSVFLPKLTYANAQAILLKSNAVKGEKLTVSDILSDYLTQWVKKQ